MTAGVLGRLPRVGVIVIALALVFGTLAFAASSTLSTPAAPTAAPAAAAPEPLVVPDVRKQAYVFAKGTLEQGGLASTLCRTLVRRRRRGRARRKKDETDC